VSLASCSSMRLRIVSTCRVRAPGSALFMKSNRETAPSTRAKTILSERVTPANRGFAGTGGSDTRVELALGKRVLGENQVRLVTPGRRRRVLWGRGLLRFRNALLHRGGCCGGA